MYYVYIIRCIGGQLYTGITSDILRRMHEHFSCSTKCAKYTRSHKAAALEALWTAENRSLASKLERRIKVLSHQQKIQLIENPESIIRLSENGEKFSPACIPEQYGIGRTVEDKI